MVEVHGLAVMERSAAEGVVAGMREAKAQESNASTMTAEETQPIWLEPETNRPPAMVPIRIAMKVAPSTSALPVASSPTASWSGKHRVFHRAEQRGDHAEQAKRDEQQRDRMQEEAGGREGGGENLGEFQAALRRPI